MKTDTVNKPGEWISVKDKLPETIDQHRLDFESEKVAVWTSEGLEVDRYYRYHIIGESGGLELESQGWLSSADVTHWREIEPPLV